MAGNKKQGPSYERKQGNKETNVPKKRNISFSISMHIKGEGQTIEEWEESGLWGKCIERIKNIGQFPTHEVRQKQYIKEYTKVDFPPNSEFTKPKHVGEVIWAVMHITPTSKEVVAGYIEDDVFYIVFLDKEHKFWPSTKKNT